MPDTGSMRIPIVFLILACSFSSCSNEDAPPSISPYPSHQAVIESPTSTGTYTTYQGTVNLSGPRDSAVSAVTWEGTATGGTGSGTVDSYWHQCCFLFSCWDCLYYYWYALDVPLQDGENLIKIYGNGTWADSILVTKVPSFSLTGSVTYGSTGQPGVTLSLVDMATTSREYTARTDAAGSYGFAFIPSGDYSLMITDPCYSFTPANVLISRTTSSIEQNFVITARSAATLSGRVTWQNNGTGVYAATVTLSTAPTATVLSARDGNYAFSCVADGQYVITPSLAFLTFDPVNLNVTVAGGADVSGLNFQMH
jgi:hypothetical protein